MTYSHSFTPVFYGDPHGGGNEERNAAGQPTTVCEALRMMPAKDWRAMTRGVFRLPKSHADCLELDTVLAEIRDTDTVGTLSVPVDVWIDRDGFWTVEVYE